MTVLHKTGGSLTFKTFSYSIDIIYILTFHIFILAHLTCMMSQTVKHHSMSSSITVPSTSCVDFFISVNIYLQLNFILISGQHRTFRDTKCWKINKKNKLG